MSRMFCHSSRNLAALLKRIDRPLVLFDLDKTVWNFTVEQGERGNLYKNTLPLLQTLYLRGHELHVCSKGHFPEASLAQMRRLEILPYFAPSRIHIFPSGPTKVPPYNMYHNKDEHITRALTGRSPSSAILLDDNEQICRAAAAKFADIIVIHTPLGL
jgi:hypothetical protein